LTIHELDLRTLETISEATSDGFFVVNSELNILHAYPGALKLIGLTKLPESKNLKDFFYKPVSIENSNTYIEAEFKDASNKPVPVLMKFIPIDNNRKLVKIVSRKEGDVTTTELLNDIQTINNQNLIKFTFLGSLGHDLMNPIHSVTGFSQAILDGLVGELSDKQAKYLSIINKNGEIIKRICNNMFYFAKYQANNLKFEFDTFTLKEILKTLETNIPDLIGSKGINFSIKKQLPEEFEIFSDREMLEQLIMNLLESSIKYNIQGQLEIVFTTPSQEQLADLLWYNTAGLQAEQFLQVSVIDEGKGIPEEERANLFEIKTPDKNDKTRKYGSSGLALISTRLLTKKMGGSVWLEPAKKNMIAINFVIPVFPPE
jgi:signal transduction histidine kinase